MAVWRTIVGLTVGLLLLVSATSATGALSSEDIDVLRVKLWKLIQKSKEPDCDDCGTPLLAQLVRLSFHDCVGGCDGLVDTNFPANAGLKVPIDALQPLYEEYYNKTAGKLSRADFYALAGTLALYKGASNQECLPSGELPAYPAVPFLLGRKDRTSTTKESTDFPDPHKGVKPTLGWGQRVFGFDNRDTVAILGAHTLGRARPYNSGFEHSWTASPDELDNSYYSDMVDQDGAYGGWKQIEVEEGGSGPRRSTGEPKHFQWVHSLDGEGLMFDSDLCLYKDLDPKETGPKAGKVTCTYAAGKHACPEQHEQVGPVAPDEEFSIAELVELYARDNYKWMQDFSKAFTAMIQTGAQTGSLAEVPYLPPLSCREKRTRMHGTQAVPREMDVPDIVV